MVRSASIGVGGVAATPVRAARPRPPCTASPGARPRCSAPCRRCAPSSRPSPTCAPRRLPRTGAGQPAAALLAGKPGPRPTDRCESLPAGGGTHEHRGHPPSTANMPRAAGAVHPHESAPPRWRAAPPTWTTSPKCAARCTPRPFCPPWPTAACAAWTPRAALAMPGVRGVVLAQDIPGDPMLAAFAGDEPVFAMDTVQHVGQVIGAGGGRHRHAGAPRRARWCSSTLTALPAILTIDDALQAQSYVLPPVFVRRGDARGRAAGRAPHPERHAGSRRPGALLPGRPDCLRAAAGAKPVAGSTPAPSTPARCSTGWRTPWAWTTMRCAWNAGAWAAALAAKKRRPGTWRCGRRWRRTSCGCPVKLRLDRDDDFMITGKRHPFAYEYTVGFDDTGRLHGPAADDGGQLRLQRRPVGPGGRPRHLPRRQRLLSGGRGDCLLPLQAPTPQSHTAFRGFGGPQGVIADRDHHGRHCPRAGARPAGRAPAQPVWHAPSATPPTTRCRWKTTFCSHCYQNWSCLRNTDKRQEAISAWNATSPVTQARPGHHAGQVRHQLHRHAVQPGRRAGACVHRRQRAGEPRRHRDGPGPAHQGGANRGRRAGRALAPRAVHRQRHQQDAQRLGHRRHRPAPTSTAAPPSLPPAMCATTWPRLSAGWTAAAQAPSALRAGGSSRPRPTRSFDDVVECCLRQPHPAVERRLLPHAQNPLRQDHAHRAAVLLLCLWRRLHRGGHRHPHRREPRAARWTSCTTWAAASTRPSTSGRSRAALCRAWAG